MFQFQNFRVDVLSFWLGVIAAAILGFLFNKVKIFIPRIINNIKSFIENSQQKRRTSIETYLKQEIVNSVQKRHIASPLFFLQDVLIVPRLLVPRQDVQGTTNFQEDLSDETVPYTPDFPELSAQFNVPSLTLAEALQKGANLILIGQPGCGKTFALAHLALQIARADPECGKLVNYFPIFIHILDIDPFVEPVADPLDKIIAGYKTQTSVMVQQRIPSFISEIVHEKRLLLLLDGLDEIPPADLKKTQIFIEALIKTHPEIQVVLSASSDYLDGFVNLNFIPMVIKAWNSLDNKNFIEKWLQLWDEKINPIVQQKHPSYEQIDPRLILNWFTSQYEYMTPLERTLLMWSVCSGDIQGTNPQKAIEAYINRISQNILPPPALEALAYELVKSGRVCLSYQELDKFFLKYKPDAALSKIDAKEESVPLTPKQSKNKGKKVSSRERAINNLIDLGVLIEHSQEQICLVNPLILGFLASRAASPEHTPDIKDVMKWSGLNSFLRYSMNTFAIEEWINGIIKDQEDEPLFSKLLFVSRYLKDSPPKSPWRISVLQRMFQLMNLETTPQQIKNKIIAAFIGSNDPSLPTLLHNMAGSPSVNVRRLAALGFGAIQWSKSINELTVLLGDSDQVVKTAACLSVGSYHSQSALEALAGILLHGDENMRIAAAISLAHHEDEGKEILKEAVGLEDILTRRAAVIGISQINETWGHLLLEKISVEDGQWVVRNVAGQAVEARQSENIYIPTPPPPPHEAPWLISFASKNGWGVSPNKSPVDMLLMALKNGDYSEKTASLQYLCRFPEEGVVKEIYDLIYKGENELSEAAIYALWLIQLSGASIPSPVKFGYH